MGKLQWKTWFLGFIAFILIGLSFGYGYFWGRSVQIEINKSIIKPILDVNCGVGK